MGRVLDSIKEWIQKQLDKITDWIRDFLAAQLEAFVIWLRLRKHDFRVWFAGFVQTTHGFWITIFVVIGIIVVGVYIQSTDQYQALVDTINDFVEKLKNGVGSILAKTGFSLINAAHNIMLMTNEQYSEAWNVFYGAISSLSEELKLGVSTISLMLRNARGVVYAAVTFAGQDEFAASLLYNDSAAAFLDKLESRFERYVRNPELIFNDIDREIVAPAIELMQAGQSNLLKTVLGLTATMSEKSQEIVGIRDSFDQFVIDMPEEIRAAFELHWAPFREQFDAFYETYILPVTTRIDAVVTEFGNLMDRQHEQLARLMLQYSAPGDMLANVFLLPEPLRSVQLQRIYDIFNYAGYDEAQLLAGEAQFNYKVSESRLNDYIQELQTAPSIKYRVPSYTPKTTKPGTFDIWYVGMNQ